MSGHLGAEGTGKEHVILHFYLRVRGKVAETCHFAVGCELNPGLYIGVSLHPRSRFYNEWLSCIALHGKHWSPLPLEHPGADDVRNWPRLHVLSCLRHRIRDRCHQFERWENGDLVKLSNPHKLKKLRHLRFKKPGTHFLQQPTPALTRPSVPLFLILSKGATLWGTKLSNISASGSHPYASHYINVSSLKLFFPDNTICRLQWRDINATLCSLDTLTFLPHFGTRRLNPEMCIGKRFTNELHL